MVPHCLFFTKGAEGFEWVFYNNLVSNLPFKLRRILQNRLCYMHQKVYHLRVMKRGSTSLPSNGDLVPRQRVFPKNDDMARMRSGQTNIHVNTLSFFLFSSSTLKLKHHSHPHGLHPGSPYIYSIAANSLVSTAFWNFIQQKNVIVDECKRKLINRSIWIIWVQKKTGLERKWLLVMSFHMLRIINQKLMKNVNIEMIG